MSIFVIPLAGMSSRFFKAGYLEPKYKLLINNETMFSWSVSSFKRFFKTDKFIFVCRNIFDTPAFIEAQVITLGIKDYDIVVLDAVTDGQAETVYLGIKNSKFFTEIDNQDLFIFNIDSKIINFNKPYFLFPCSGYLEVFIEQGEQWSFVEPLDSILVKRTTEKKRVSDLCSDGLYYFQSIQNYLLLFEYCLSNKLMNNNEFYIAPMYNLLIDKGDIVKYLLVPRNNIIICGTPADYENLTETGVVYE